MNKSNCKACKTAHEMLNMFNEMLEEGKNPTLAEMHEYNVVSTFCDKMLGNEMWKHYNVETRGAIYPSDMEKHFDENCAKKWVNEMYHKTSSGAKVCGEHWDINATNSVAKQHNIDMSNLTHEEFYITMNMMWHDHFNSAVKAGMENEVTFYVELAKDFLFDDDGKTPHEKLVYYYDYLS